MGAMRVGLRITALVLLTLLACAPCASADDAQPNAADLYVKIWDEQQHEYVESRAIHLETQTLGERGWTPGPVVSRELASEERMARITAAARTERCDFGLDYSQGPSLLLPHWSNVGASATLLLCDAQLNARDGDIDRAVERLVDAMRVARHTEHEQHLIGVAERAETADTAARIALGIPRNQWTPDAAQRLLDAVSWFDGEDPFKLREHALNEGRSTAAWLTRLSRTVEGRDRFFEFARMMVSLDGQEIFPSRFRFGWQILAHGGFERCIADYERAVRDQVAALDAPNAQEALDAVTDRLTSGEYGPIARGFVSNLRGIRRREFDARSRLSALRLLLRDVAERRE